MCPPRADAKKPTLHGGKMSAKSHTTTLPTAVTGRLETISLFDLCQFLLLERKTGTLAARCHDSKVSIYFKEGVIHSIIDDSQRSGEKVLSEAIHWQTGIYTFDPMPIAIKRQITDSTEDILLRMARQIDGFKARSGEETNDRTQEVIFRERQAYPGELADAFRLASKPLEETGISRDPVQDLLNDIQRAQGTLLVRGRHGILRSADGVWPYTVGLEPEKLLEQLNLPAPRPGEVFNRRFERASGWFHIRVRHFGGDLQIFLASLLQELPDATEIGLDPTVLEPLLEKDRGLYLWTGIPRGHRSKALRYWLGHTTESTRGTTLWLEESPRVAWEVVSWTSHYVGDPQNTETVAGLLEWNPEILVVDPVRLPSVASLALEMAEAGAKTIAVSAGLTVSSAVIDFLNMLVRSGIQDPGARLGRVLSGWIGILPLRDSDNGPPIVATQVTKADSDLALVMSRGAPRADIERWERITRPVRSFSSEIERLERAGRIDPGAKALLRRDLSAFAS